MRLPQCPNSTAELDLMKRLRAYADGTESWLGGPIGSDQMQACSLLHASIARFLDEVVHPLLNRTNAREMTGFTMHDKKHGLKVSHLMWYIIDVERRQRLTPVEIALLVLSAHVHDLGMCLSDEERKARLSSSSDLWDSLDPKSPYLAALDELTKLSKDVSSDVVARTEATYQIHQAQEALLCDDTRARHATRNRYQEIILSLEGMHRRDEVRIPNAHSIFSFGGDSFETKLIEICVSHNEGAEALLERDANNPDQWRLPTAYPVGSCVADTRFVAAALRLADILDFDRERTPVVLFHYLLPQSGDPASNASIREWSKHLAIANWEIEGGKLLYRGRSNNVLTHHAIVEFSKVIEHEISGTKEILSGDGVWPFVLSSQVSLELEAEGYRYIPYRFSIDEERVYNLFMGSRVYKNRLDAVRELVQNAVDACRLKDALLVANDPSVSPSDHDRIIVRYEEPTPERANALLSVTDTGTGMDRWLIDNYFLKVGRSYYSSTDFLRTMANLRNSKSDFAPVAEFGIGFLSCFMLGDRIDVQTAHWAPAKQDVKKRHLKIDGVGRLIEVSESPNDGPARFSGTSVSLTLSKFSSGYEPPTWDEIKDYLVYTCVNIAYSIKLQRIGTAGDVSNTILTPSKLTVSVPEHLVDVAVRIPVDTTDIVGEIILYRESDEQNAESKLLADARVQTVDRDEGQPLLRGGFRIGSVPNLPHVLLARACDALIEVKARGNRSKAFPGTDLARGTVDNVPDIGNAVFQQWFEFILKNIKEFETRLLGDYELTGSLSSIWEAKWLERYSALEIFRAAKIFWKCAFRAHSDFDKKMIEWEKGKGGQVELGHWRSSLHRPLLALMLPRVCAMVALPKGNQALLPPRAGWEAEMSACKTFITKPVPWPRFVKYSDEIADVVVDLYPGGDYFNIAYKSRFVSFKDEEIVTLTGILDRAHTAKNWKRRVRLSGQHAELLRRAIHVAGDLSVSHLGMRFRISDLG